MSLLTLNVLAIGIIGGAFIASLFENKRSPILSDRLIIAGLGALMGLICAGAILGGWQIATLAFAMLEAAL